MLDRWQVDKKAARLLNALRTSSWMQYGDGRKVIPFLGGRQGCKAGGLVFGSIYDNAPKEVKAALSEAGCAEMLGLWINGPFWTRDRAGMAEKLELSDVENVDHAAYYLSAASPKAMLEKITKTIEIIIAVFTKYSLKLNWAKCKSELMISLRGAKACKRREALRQEDGSLAFPLPAGGAWYVRSDR